MLFTVFGREKGLVVDWTGAWKKKLTRRKFAGPSMHAGLPSMQMGVGVRQMI